MYRLCKHIEINTAYNIHNRTNNRCDKLSQKVYSHIMQRILPPVLFTSLLACALSSASVYANSKTLFRYTNAQGSQVITDAIPPQYASQGYDIINSSGQVISVVPPEPSAEEKAKSQREQAEKQRMAKWDKELLSRYSSTEDIEATKQRRVKDIENSIFSLRLTLKNISETITFYQAEAATNERQGEAVSTDTLNAINRLQKDRTFIEDEIDKKEDKKKQVADNYNKDIARFNEIKPTKQHSYP